MVDGSSLDFEAGERLVRTARRSVDRVVTDEVDPSPPGDQPAVLGEQRGAFVTLRKEGSLRGCIGEPYATQPLIESVVSAAVGAATRDPRFPPVRENELDAITVEVSALTSPVPIEADDPAALVEHVTVGTDGLIIADGERNGLLLPQVAVEQGWDAETFLAETCRKAGLPTDRWRTDGVRIERFSVDRFEEREPRGEVVTGDVLDG
ncbi:MAG TPA: AmmeMemoRadiSam system protein A [Natrialbaceae archaeon]|nr:AmmeMemoRadiSam system protein A [Natrialbaceae archaeon]